MTLTDPLDPPFPHIPIPASSLRGPADAENFRIQHGRYGTRWYVDPLPADDKWSADDEENRYPAISTVKKAVGQDWTRVGLKRVAETVAKRPDRFMGMDATEIYDAMVADNERGLRRAAGRGTNVHTYFEQGLRGQPIVPTTPGEPGSEYLAAVRSFFAAYEPKLVVAEYVTIHRDLNGVGYGATGDAIVEVTHGKDGGRALAAIDWKSRKDEGTHTCYPQEAAQVAGCARGQYMIVETPIGAARMDLPHVDLGLVVSIRPDGFRCYPVDVDEAFRHYTAMHAWWAERRNERKSIGRVWPPRMPKSLSKMLKQCDSRDEAVALWRMYGRTEDWTPQMSADMARRFPRA